jgi:hypothetical protein
MSRLLSIALLSYCGLTPMVGDAKPFVSLDECLETRIDPASLPASLPGQLAVVPCPNCAPMLLAVTQSTRFFVGEQGVSMSLMRKYAQRDGRQIRVCHDTKRQATRIIVTGVLDAADRTP